MSGKIFRDIITEATQRYTLSHVAFLSTYNANALVNEQQPGVVVFHFVGLPEIR